MIIEQMDLHGGVENFAGAAIGNGCWGSDCFYGVTESEIDFHTFRVRISCRRLWQQKYRRAATANGRTLQRQMGHAEG